MTDRAVKSARALLLAALTTTACGGPAEPRIPPAVVLAVPGGTSTIDAGATLTVQTEVRDDRGRVVSAPTVIWTSSDVQVASVTPSGATSALVTGTKAGQSTITAASLGAQASITVSVRPGAPVTLAIRTQPAGAAVGQPLITAPVIEVRDAFGNLTSAQGAVTVTLQGGGSLDGATGVVPVNGLAAFTPLAITGAVGTRTLTFSYGSLVPVTSQGFPLEAGPASVLALRRAPEGAGLNGPFATQPQIEVRDIGGNPVRGTPSITAAISAGGGTLTGSTVTAADGLATFAALGITGTPGARTIAFTSPGLAPVSATVTPCDANRGPRLAVSPSARLFTAVRFGADVADTVSVSDAVASCTTVAGLAASVAYVSGSGWLSATVTPTGNRVALRASPGTAGAPLNAGSYDATVQLTATGATPVLLPVSFTVLPSVTVTYGQPTQKINEVSVGETFRIAATARTDQNADVSNTLAYASRSPSIASVAVDGTVQGIIPGRAWIVASDPTGGIDSIFVSVRRASGPVLRLDLTSWRFTRLGTIAVNVVLDTRGSAVGAAQLQLTWPTLQQTPPMLTLTTAVPGAVGNPVITSDAAAGITRISIVSASGLSGVIPVARLEFNAAQAGLSQLVLRAVDMVDVAGVSLLGSVSMLQYPLLVVP